MTVIVEVKVKSISESIKVTRLLEDHFGFNVGKSHIKGLTKKILINSVTSKEVKEVLVRNGFKQVRFLDYFEQTETSIVSNKLKKRGHSDPKAGTPVVTKNARQTIARSAVKDLQPNEKLEKISRGSGIWTVLKHNIFNTTDIYGRTHTKEFVKLRNDKTGSERAFTYFEISRDFVKA